MTAGGSIKLDRAAAAAAITKLGEPLGLGLFEAASGIAKIAEFQMADLIRKVTIQKGHDPRDFVLFAFGGAGPVHAGVFAHELGVQKVIIPQRETASVWCAFGAASADILHVYERVNIMRSPFDLTVLNAVLSELKIRGDDDLAADQVAAAERRYRFTLDMRHKGQINEVEVDIAGEALAEGHSFIPRPPVVAGPKATLTDSPDPFAEAAMSNAPAAAAELTFPFPS